MREDLDTNFKKHIGEEKEMCEEGSGLAQETNNGLCRGVLSVTGFSSSGRLVKGYPKKPV